ncbi:unnamed protein product [Leptidea sinapis]|uniref:Uncharacterized protein n=1 Tax=Leptidea sinapis TaxID=189913 RepID=A0A5E4QHS5_9NEOP|nr:unnamed protein product [Leptidea sinapis]
MAGGRRAARGVRGPRGTGPGGAGRGVELIDSRARCTEYLSSHRSTSASFTKKEIGFADFDPFVFGQRPAMRAGAEKCEGALIGRAGSAPLALEPSECRVRRTSARHSQALSSRPVVVHCMRVLTIRLSSNYQMSFL